MDFGWKYLTTVNSSRAIVCWIGMRSYWNELARQQLTHVQVDRDPNHWRWRWRWRWRTTDLPTNNPSRRDLRQIYSVLHMFEKNKPANFVIFTKPFTVIRDRQPFYTYLPLNINYPPNRQLFYCLKCSKRIWELFQSGFFKRVPEICFEMKELE